MHYSRHLLQRIFFSPLNSSHWRGLLVLLLLAGGLAVYWVSLLGNHQKKVQDLQRQTQLRSFQLSRTLAVQTQTLFSGLDFVAQNLVAEYAEGYAEGFDRAVNTAVSSYPQGAIVQIAVADREGNVVYSNLQDTPRRTSNASNTSSASIRDRTHFLVHAQSSDSGLYISQPLMGRVSQLWTIQLSRAIRSQGRFEGVVVISVAPSYLSGAYRDILEHSGDVIMLLRSDGAYLARSRNEELAVGKFVTSPLEFLRTPDKVHGIYDLTTPIDGVPRHYAWHRVGGLPLLVSIGLEQQTVWAPLRAELHTSLVRSGMGSALLLIAAVLIGRLTLQRSRARDQAARSEELLRKLVTLVPGGLFQLHMQADGSLHLPYASPGLYQLHHLSPGAAKCDGQALRATLHPDDAQRVHAELRRASANLTPWQGRYRVNDDEGQVRWLLSTAQPERHADGSVLWHGYVQDMTQEYKMQEALRTSEEHLRLTMEAVHDGLWQWTPGSNLVHWDARCWEMLGYPAAAKELTHDTMLAWMHPGDQEIFHQHVGAHLEHGAHYHCEFRLRTAAGGWLWVEARGNIIDTSDDEPPRMLGTHTDISERVAHAQLRRALLEESAAAILLATPDRRIAQANQRAHSIFGTPGACLAGQSMQLIHPDTASFEASQACYAELRAHGKARREWLLRLGDGSSRWCDVQGSLLDPQDPQGQVTWTIVDIDDRHRAEIALRTAQQRLTAIIDCFPSAAMLQAHLNGPIVAMNQALCDLLRLPAPTTHLPPELEQRIRDMLPAEMLDEPQAPQHQRLPRVLRIEQSLSGGRTLEVQRIPLWQDGRHLGLFWLLHDITQRKQRESTLERLATTDTLTALPNRRAFMERLQQEFDAIRHHHAPPGVLIMLDIDFFKKVNDTWGHAVGDQVLRHLAKVLRQSLRRGDMAGRLGGEEFAILLAQATPHAGLQLAERLRACIETTPSPSDQGDISFTASLGVSVLDGALKSIDEGLARADAALYHAKRHGRNQVCAWEEGMAPTQAKLTR